MPKTETVDQFVAFVAAAGRRLGSEEPAPTDPALPTAPAELAERMRRELQGVVLQAFELDSRLAAIAAALRETEAKTEPEAETNPEAKL